MILFVIGPSKPQFGDTNGGQSVRFESRWDLGVRSDKIFGDLVMKVLLQRNRQSALVLEF